MSPKNIDKALSAILKKYQDNFSSKAYVEDDVYAQNVVGILKK